MLSNFLEIYTMGKKRRKKKEPNPLGGLTDGHEEGESEREETVAEADVAADRIGNSCRSRLFGQN